MDILAIMMMTYSWLKFTVMLLFTIFVVTLYIKIYVLLLYIPLYLHLPDDGSLSPKCVWGFMLIYNLVLYSLFACFGLYKWLQSQCMEWLILN